MKDRLSSWSGRERCVKLYMPLQGASTFPCAALLGKPLPIKPQINIGIGKSMALYHSLQL